VTARENFLRAVECRCPAWVPSADVPLANIEALAESWERYRT
jgi:hypothetical protein